MSIIGWVCDFFGIQKDMYEMKKTRLEIEKIEDEKKERLIIPATVEDVRECDPKAQMLSMRAQAWREQEKERIRRKGKQGLGHTQEGDKGCVVLLLLVLLLAFVLFTILHV